MQTDLGRYLPNYYEGIRETDGLMSVENSMFDELKSEMRVALDNQFILTCDVRVLSVWEEILGIMFNPDTESEDFRRERITNRLSTRPPFTLWFLRQRLDVVLGRENYELYMDYDNCTLQLESTTSSMAVRTEMALTMDRILPANIVFELALLFPNQLNIYNATALTTDYQQTHIPAQIFGDRDFEIDSHASSNILIDFKQIKLQGGNVNV